MSVVTIKDNVPTVQCVAMSDKNQGVIAKALSDVGHVVLYVDIWTNDEGEPFLTTGKYGTK